MFQKEKDTVVSLLVGSGLNVLTDVIAKHEAKVYGKASVGAPPMSVPHRFSHDRWSKALLFGPLQDFRLDFKNGSYSDLPLSNKPDISYDCCRD
jgi:L-2-hydroxyglutarate oxidase LhgO